MDSKSLMNEEILGEYSDFIGVYENALTPEFCYQIIETFDYHHQTNAVWDDGGQFPNSVAGRFNWSIDLQHMCPKMGLDRPDRELNTVLIRYLEEYIDVFGHLKTSRFYTPTQKVQKTPAGGGYHVWHDENTSGGSHASRKMVWMIYLNDDFEGGETEFLYYKRRIQPKTGTLLIWPAGLTHAHRGGLVLSKCKYVVTGWFYASPEFEE